MKRAEPHLPEARTKPSGQLWNGLNLLMVGNVAHDLIASVLSELRMDRLGGLNEFHDGIVVRTLHVAGLLSPSVESIPFVESRSQDLDFRSLLNSGRSPSCALGSSPRSSPSRS